MLRNIDPLLSPDLLHALRRMGHGDMIAIGDANFPGESLGPECIRADGSTAARMLEAVLSVMPLDTFIDDPAVAMQMVDTPETTPEVVAEFQRVIDEHADRAARIKSIERFAFYDLARQAHVILMSGEPRPYGNIILTKGVVL